MTEPACGTCRFWQQRGRDAGLGWCFRYPPVAVLPSPENPLNAPVHDGVQTIRPTTAWLVDWCGEYVRRADEEPVRQ